VATHDLADLVAATGELATLPETVAELLHIYSDPTMDASRVQRIIERDPSMTANVLKLANSAFYGRNRKIGTVRDALVMLGNRSVATLAVATGMAPILRTDLKGYGLGRSEFWQHSLVSAAAASLVGSRLGVGDMCCEMFTAGLIHDVGMLVLNPALVMEGLVLEREVHSFNVCHAEQDAFGFDHCQAGALLAEAWGFPDLLREPILYHHEILPGDAMTAGVKAVAVASLLAQTLEGGLALRYRDDLADCLEALDLPRDLPEELRLDLTENLSQTLTGATRPQRVGV